MAYCVHCGVKLGEGEESCPLCGIKSIDPLAQRKDSEVKAYPVHTPEQEIKRSVRYITALTALMLLFPALLCVLIDLTVNHALTWSRYAFLALILLFAAIVIPFLFKKHRVYVSTVTTIVMLNIYLYFVEKFNGASDGWYVSIVLPLMLYALAVLLLIMEGYRREKLNKLTGIAVFFMGAAIGLIITEIMVSLRYMGSVSLLWSPIAAVPCVFISLLFFFINHDRRIREEFRRRVHF